MHADGDVDYKAVAADIADIIKKDPDKGPTLVRLVSITVISYNVSLCILILTLTKHAIQYNISN